MKCPVVSGPEKPVHWMISPVGRSLGLGGGVQKAGPSVGGGGARSRSPDSLSAARASAATEAGAWLGGVIARVGPAPDGGASVGAGSGVEAGGGAGAMGAAAIGADTAKTGVAAAPLGRLGAFSTGLRASVANRAAAALRQALTFGDEIDLEM